MSTARVASEAAVVDAGYDMFAPEGIAPEEFWGLEQLGVQGGERKLMAAILSDGIESYITYHLKRARGEEPHASGGATSEVAEWVDSSDRSYVFSFDTVCESLGIDPNYLRLGLRRYVGAMRTEQHAADETAGKIVQWTKIRRPRVA